jgi:glycosyltransferase involved in cell wall biosynthesis
VSGLLALVAGKDPLDEPGGGHSAYVRAYARAAVAAGYAPEILCVGRTAAVRETEFGTIRRVRSPFRPLRQLMIAGHSPLLAGALVELARRREGPVLAHGFGVWSHAGVRACARLRGDGRAATAVVGSYTTILVEAQSQVRAAAGAPARARLSYAAQALWARAVVERYERAAYRGAERVFVNYDAVARIVAERHGPGVRVARLAYGPESGFASAPGGVEVPAAIARLEPAGAPLVVCVARHHARKGVDVLIEALARLRDEGTPVRACLVGDGPLLDADGARVEALGLAAGVAVTGLVEAIDPYLAAADVFALPSREEQSGALALLEALRHGLPVVASAVDGIPEDVVDGESALLVPPGDPAALAAALRRLVTDPPLRERLGRAAHRTFAERFSAERFAADVGAAYAALGLPPPAQV